jgi:GAF domain-containing protein
VVKQAALGSVLRLPRRLAHWTAEAAANAKVTIESLASEYAILFRLRDGKYHMAWSNNADPEWVKYWSEHPLGMDRGSVVGRTAHERRAVHIPDRLTDPEYTMHEAARLGKQRSMLGVPLLRDGVPIGTITLLRTVMGALQY